MINPIRLDAVALAVELNKLPLLNAVAATPLDPAHLAIARAVATGQSADELNEALTIPAAWASLDIFKAPASTPAATSGSAATPSASHTTQHGRLPLTLPITTLRPISPTVPVLPVTVAPVMPTVPLRPIVPVTPVVPVVPVVPVAPVRPIVQPPTWAVNLIPIVLKETTTTRVAVLDREPTALGGLETPAWARALTPSAVYGPVTATSTGVQLQTPKWILVYTFAETVQIVRGGVVLCVLPLSLFHIGSQKQATVTAGSAWIAAHPLSNDAPANSFAGLNVSSGAITSDQPLSINAGVVNLPATAAVTLTLVPAVTPAGAAGSPATVTAPGKITVNFPATGAPTIAFDTCSATIYGQALHSTPLPRSLPRSTTHC